MDNIYANRILPGYEMKDELTRLCLPPVIWGPQPAVRLGEFDLHPLSPDWPYRRAARLDYHENPFQQIQEIGKTLLRRRKIQNKHQCCSRARNQMRNVN
jgi:hypothetical protein